MSSALPLFAAELSARPGRHRHGLRAGHRRRHGQGPGRRLRARRCARPRAGQDSSRGSGKGRPPSCSPSAPAAPISARSRRRRRDSGDAWLLNGFKWFASNCNGEAFVVLAKPEGAPDSSRGVANFLVLRTRRDGTRNGVRIRRLKDKLGTRSVASGEVEFVDAEAFLLSGEPSGDAGPADGKGLGRMMELTNAARLGIAAVRARQRPARPGRVAVLRAAAPGVRRRADRQAADAAQARRDDRRRRGRAGAGVRRHRRWPTIASRRRSASASRCP